MICSLPMSMIRLLFIFCYIVFAFIEQNCKWSLGCSPLSYLVWHFGKIWCCWQIVDGENLWGCIFFPKLLCVSQIVCAETGLRCCNIGHIDIRTGMWTISYQILVFTPLEETTEALRTMVVSLCNEECCFVMENIWKYRLRRETQSDFDIREHIRGISGCCAIELPTVKWKGRSYR